MDWLGALGSAAQGVTAGLQDLDRMEDRKYTKQRRAREQKQWEDEDAYKQDLSTLDANAPDYYTQAATAAQRRGLYKDAVQFKGMADAQVDRTARLRREEIADRQAALERGVQEAYFRYHGMNDVNGALRALQGAYDHYPDGYKLVVNKDGTYGVANPSGKWEVAPMQATPENMQQTLAMAMKFMNPKLWSVYQADEREGKKLGLDSRRLDITEKHYGDQNAYWQGSLANDRERNRLYGDGLKAKEGGTPNMGRVGLSDETQTFYDPKTGMPVHNMLPGGILAPLGVDATTLQMEQSRASKAGVRAGIVNDAQGKPILAYQGRDGQFYQSLEAAAAARPQPRK